MPRFNPCHAAVAVMVSVITAGCGDGHRCSPMPCPLQIAVRVEVVSANGDPIPGATVQSSGAVTTTPMSCRQGALGNQCEILGGPGRYDLRVSAAGFQTATQSVTVPGTSESCGCGSITAQLVSVTLTPGSGQSAPVARAAALALR